MCGRAIEFVGKGVDGNSERLDSSKIFLKASTLYQRSSNRKSYHQVINELIFQFHEFNSQDIQGFKNMIGGV